jgi:ribosome-binding factor A
MPCSHDAKRLLAGSNPDGRQKMSQDRKKISPRDDQAKGPSQRMLRVGELVRHKMAEMLARGEIHDDLLAGHVITIPEVRMAPDLKLATIYVMPLGGKDTTRVLAALERNKRYIRGEISHTLGLKFAPDVRFREDESFAEARRIDALLDSPKVKQDLDKPNN